MPGVAQSILFFDQPGNKELADAVEAVEALFVMEQPNLGLVTDTSHRLENRSVMICSKSNVASEASTQCRVYLGLGTKCK